jgi:hypothetical protein
MKTKRPRRDPEEEIFQCDLCLTTTNNIYNKMPLCPDHKEQVRVYRASHRVERQRKGQELNERIRKTK